MCVDKNSPKHIDMRLSAQETSFTKSLSSGLLSFCASFHDAIRMYAFVIMVMGLLHHSFGMISASRGQSYDHNLILFLKQPKNIFNETFCGGISLTRFHILTTTSCAKRVKKFSLVPTTVHGLNEAETEAAEADEDSNKISEIYLDRDHDVAIVLLSRPEPEVGLRGRKQPRRRQLGLKVESPMTEYIGETLQGPMP